METLAEAEIILQQEYSKLTKTQKLAALLLMLHPDNAVQIMKQLDDDCHRSLQNQPMKVESKPATLSGFDSYHVS